MAEAEEVKGKTKETFINTNPMVKPLSKTIKVLVESEIELYCLLMTNNPEVGFIA